ncbi:MAG TPA: nitroreductase family protein [Rhizomicrobium sp.]|nr:nitroreductase family protein [Rhizomicrobium sp.]
MELSAAIYGRRSTRNFSNAPVGDSELREVIKAATFAPSAMNEQPCQFTVVTDQALLRKISRDAKAYELEEFGKESHIDHMREMLSDPKYDIFYGAPALVVISAPAGSRWAVEDCALAAENLMLAAHEMKLGTCWIGFAQEWLATPEGHRAISLDESYAPVAPIIVGHVAAAMPKVDRRAPKVNWIR